MENLKKRLEKRGWKNHEIEKAVGIIARAKQNKTKENLFLGKRVFWILLIVLIASNFAVSVAMVPLLMALKGAGLYFVIIVLGLVFGFVFELVIRTIEHLEYRHHLFLAVFIPLTALINAFIISGLSNDMAAGLGMQNPHSPLAVGIVYAASFVLPYLVYRFILKMEYYAKE
ncbi:hypothetical protein HYX06_03515 [Candidatus Woesearchaeota archaeon]|nr:hypothetical protein [Candidatus Woesearchaeota archaeon]